jgi:hypothetical protein
MLTRDSSTTSSEYLFTRLLLAIVTCSDGYVYGTYAPGSVYAALHLRYASHVHYTVSSGRHMLVRRKQHTPSAQGHTWLPWLRNSMSFNNTALFKLLLCIILQATYILSFVHSCSQHYRHAVTNTKSPNVPTIMYYDCHCNNRCHRVQ